MVNCFIWKQTGKNGKSWQKFKIRYPKTEMIHCKDCIHWSLDEPCGEAPNLHLCNHPKCNGDIDDCFGCFDGEPYNAGAFFSGPDFGCIHGEKKAE